jgi:membrane protein DedA with SNARE-associated domain
MNEAISFLIRHGYSVIFLWVFAEKVGLPLPTAPVLLAAGVLAGEGRLQLAAALLLAVLAALLGDQIWYQVGRFRGSRVLALACRVSLDPDSCVRQAKNLFARHGARSLLVAKFVPGLNITTSPLAGMFRMPLRRFLLFDGLGIFLWAGFYTGLGFLFSHRIEQLFSRGNGLGPWVTFIGPAAMGGYIVWKYIQRRRFLRRLFMTRISPEELKEKIDAGEDVLILDVRHVLEFEALPQIIAGAFHLPMEEIDKTAFQIPRDREVVLCCA